MFRTKQQYVLAVMVSFKVAPKKNAVILFRSVGGLILKNRMKFFCVLTIVIMAVSSRL